MSTLLIIANILGYIGLVLLYIQVVFGTRHIFKYVTDNTVLVNKLHSTIGKYAIFAVFLHPLLSMMNRLEDFLWIITPNWNIETEAHITFGRFAFILFLVVWVTSALVREKIKWHPWKWMHLLAYPIVFLTFLHIREIGTFYEEFVVIQFAWAFFFFILIASTILRLAAWAGITKQKYTLADRKLVGTDIVLITLKPIRKAVTSNIGQHFFLQARPFRSEHPFTVIRNTDGTVEFGIRKVAKFWDEINAIGIGSTVYVDGPYGVFTKEAQNDKPKIIISAGIGVTPFIDLAQKYGANTTYINCNRKIEEAVERDLIKSKVSKYIDIVDAYEGAPDENIIVGRISEQLITQIIGNEHHTTPVFVCGSPGFIKAVKLMFVNLGTPNNLVYYEELGF
jgi:predicted ferric reductase